MSDEEHDPEPASPRRRRDDTVVDLLHQLQLAHAKLEKDVRIVELMIGAVITLLLVVLERVFTR